MRKMSFTKLKAISHSLSKALVIPLCCTFTKFSLLCIAKIRDVNQGFLKVRSTLYFLNEF